MSGSEVRRCSSTTIPPRGPMASPAAAASVTFGLTPTAIRTRSAGMSPWSVSIPAAAASPPPPPAKPRPDDDASPPACFHLLADRDGLLQVAQHVHAWEIDPGQGGTDRHGSGGDDKLVVGEFETLPGVHIHRLDDLPPGVDVFGHRLVVRVDCLHVLEEVLIQIDPGGSHHEVFVVDDLLAHGFALLPRNLPGVLTVVTLELSHRGLFHQEGTLSGTSSDRGSGGHLSLPQ